MSSRDRILGLIAQNKPRYEELPLPDLSCAVRYEDVCHQFISMIERIGAEVVYVDSRGVLSEDVSKEQTSGRRMINLLDNGREDGHVLSARNASDLQDVHTCYLHGKLGVAENGAIWVEERDMGNRLLPFICERLVLVVPADRLVDTMHEAYREITMENTGFGVFIAGPSRTADIEQNLVIGAHGPARMTVYIV
jgi:L-lactate dehydrogenase complex protein LldG